MIENFLVFETYLVVLEIYDVELSINGCIRRLEFVILAIYADVGEFVSLHDVHFVRVCGFKIGFWSWTKGVFL